MSETIDRLRAAQAVRCDVRCWRIGQPASYVDGVCDECGSPEPPDTPPMDSQTAEPERQRACVHCGLGFQLRMCSVPTTERKWCELPPTTQVPGSSAPFSLQDELDELERNDPDVAKAKREYDEMSAKVRGAEPNGAHDEGWYARQFANPKFRAAYVKELARAACSYSDETHYQNHEGPSAVPCPGCTDITRALSRYAHQQTRRADEAEAQVSSAYTGICPYCKGDRGGTMKGRLENPYCAGCLHERLEKASAALEPKGPST